MTKIHKTIVINAPRERVWSAMLDDATYREWTAEFNPGSYYKGEWVEGSKMLFLGPNPAGGGEGGMVSVIREVRPNEYVKIEHRGIVGGGVEDTESDEAKKWQGFEEYTFKDTEGGTELFIEVDMADEMAEEMGTMWDKALVKLKEVAERA